VLTAEQADSRELMVRAQNGDLDAFTELYTRYRNYVHAIAYQSHPGYADDLTHDVWIRVLRCLHTWKDQNKDPIAWLTIITRNICRDLAKSSYMQRVELVAAPPDRTAEPERTDPAVLAGDPIARRNLLAAMQLLTQDQREAVALYHLRDLPVAEIADRMGRTPRAVKLLLHRGRHAIARHMTEKADA